MFNKSALIQMDGEDTFVWYKSKFQNIDKINVDLKNKNLYLILSGERVYIKLLTVPKVSSDKLYKIIEYELKYYFNDVEDILFDYYIYNSLNNSYEVAVFCINSGKLNNLKNLLHKEKRIRLVNLIQFVIFEYVNEKIKQNKYTLIFLYNSDLYILAVEDGIIKENSIIKNFQGDYKEFLSELDLVTKLEDRDKNKYHIYFLWFDYLNIIEDLNKIYTCKILNYDEEKVIGKVIRDWKCMSCIR